MTKLRLKIPFTPKECIRLQRKFSKEELDDIENVIYGTKWMGKYTFCINHKPFGVKAVKFKCITPLDILDKLTGKSLSLDFKNCIITFGKDVIQSDVSIRQALYKAAILFLNDVE